MLRIKDILENYMINVTAAIIEYDDSILAVRRAPDKHLAGFWEFPGGKVESNETLKNCLKRELKEELDIDVTIGDYIGQSTYDYGNKLIRLHAFIVPVDSTTFSLTDHDRSKWLNYDDLEEMKWAPADIPIVYQLKTYLFYRSHTEKYVSETFDIKLTDTLQSFTDCLPSNASILDIGCGSGRDALYFLKHGYDVIAIDMVNEMAVSASKKLSREVLVRSYFNLDFKNKFDGVWSSASLLHCPKSEFISAVKNIADALKLNGIAYISLKHGRGESLDNFGRYFSYYTEQEITALFDGINNLSITRLWLNESNLRDSNQVWINLLIRKVACYDY